MHESTFGKLSDTPFTKPSYIFAQYQNIFQRKAQKLIKWLEGREIINRNYRNKPSTKRRPPLT